ncbi:hypothetical protein Bca4012_027507 [Brassica carinata]
MRSYDKVEGILPSCGYGRSSAQTVTTPETPVVIDTTLEAVSNLETHVMLHQAESDSQAAVDFITDSQLPISDPLAYDPATPTIPVSTTSSSDQIFHFSSLPLTSSTTPTLPVVVPSSSSPPLPPPSSPKNLVFTSEAAPASIVVIPVMRAPHSNSYISKKQAASFNSPLITLNPFFFHKASAS